MGWRAPWPTSEKAGEILSAAHRGTIEVGVGAVEYAPDYRSQSEEHSTRVTVPISPGTRELERHLSRIVQMIRDLRPGQSVVVAYYGEGRVQVTLVDVVEDPA